MRGELQEEWRGEKRGNERRREKSGDEKRERW